MGGVNLNVQIKSGRNIGGVYPFVVVCFDNNIKSELFKTEAVQGGSFTRWDHVQAVDFTQEMKTLMADGHPEPKYLTFFIFDTGARGVPSLGSAGVLLQTVQENGIAQGEFPIVGGTPGASLDLVVSQEKLSRGQEGFLHSNTAKIAGGVGVAALASGLAALAIKQHKKKKGKKPKKNSKKEGTRSIDPEGEEEEEEEEEKKGLTRGRPWWDPTTSSSSSEEDEDENEEENEDKPGDEAEDAANEEENEGGDDEE